MEDFQRILERVKKNPQTLPMKSFRFLKKKYYQFQAKKMESQSPMTHEEFRKKTDFKGEENINDKHLFTEEISKDLTIKDTAENILKGKYEIFGKEYHLTEINWHKDFSSGKIWEKKHFSTLEYDHEGDKKIPWELSKCHHFVTLGLAYQQTKDKKYFQEYKKQLLHWIQENPYEIGINWVTPMECAIRAINWIEAYHLFKEEFDESLTTELAKQLYLHGKHIRSNMEWSPAKENHYLSDCMGLFFIGCFFKDIKEAEKWKIFAQKELEREIIHQVSEDGVDYEASLNYHRLVTEMFLLTYILALRNNISFSEEYKKRLEKMCEFIMYYTSPSGKAPAFGDTDNGRILSIWDPDINDHRDLLSLAAFYFQRPDFKARGKYHPSMQLLLKKEDFASTPIEEKELTSKTFTGWYIMRDKDIFIMIHCGDIGRKGFGGHGHNDQLSFVLSTKNQDYIIDPGTYTYTTDKKKRHLFRSTACHNTLVVNNQEQNTIEEETPFNMKHRTKAFCFQWQTDKFQDIFIGKHFGYTPNIVTREIRYDKRKKEIQITDRLKQDAELELNIFFHPKIGIKQEGKKIILNEELEIDNHENSILSNAPYSQEYGNIGETKKITLKKKGNLLQIRISMKDKRKEDLIEGKTKKIKKEKIQKKETTLEEEYY